ncbi:MAG: hypothetical protein HY319_05230 [Armatimonadetes bacterium]|nr:hypothetical protein [Armatimonadota bacterium]
MADRPDPYIERLESSYTLGGKVKVDVDDFLGLVEVGNRTYPGGADEGARLWESALSLFQGDYLEEYPYQEWTNSERERLRSIFLEVAGRLARHHLERGDLERAVETCHTLLERDRCWEEAYRILMEVHLRNRRSFLAARTYEQCCQALEEELGVSPSEETQALYRRVSHG